MYYKSRTLMVPDRDSSASLVTADRPTENDLCL